MSDDDGGYKFELNTCINMTSYVIMAMFSCISAETETT